MLKWLLVRHALTDEAVSGKIQGHLDTPLNKEGLRQAHVLRERLASERIDVAYCSDLVRAVETAQIILKDRSVSLVKSPKLRELNYGEWEGKDFKQVERENHEMFLKALEASLDFAPPGGETPRHLIGRVKSYLSEVELPASDNTLLVVGHAGSIRGLLINLLSLPGSMFWRVQIDRSSLSIVEMYPNGGVLTLLNDTCHLREIEE